MTAVARLADSTTSTPLSETLATPVRITRLPLPDLVHMHEPAWQESVVRQLEDLSALDEGWDGFRAGPIRRDVITFAVRVLESIMRPSTPPPHITPMSHEGLMLEWHRNGFDLEIEIEKPGQLWMSLEDTVEGIEDERPLLGDLSPLTVPIGKLTLRVAPGR